MRIEVREQLAAAGWLPPQRRRLEGKAIRGQVKALRGRVGGAGDS